VVTKPEAKVATPQAWWQWVLLYPALAIALITAVPQWLGAVQRLTGNPNAEEEQNKKLWSKNLECTGEPMDFFINPENIKVAATICRSGDVFVRIFPPDNLGDFYWVDIKSILGKSSDSDSLSTASVSESVNVPTALSAKSSYVMCQRFVDDRHLLRVVNVGGGSCWDETVDTYTGAVIERKESQCREAC
jgi:hypothetical protein